MPDEDNHNQSIGPALSVDAAIAGLDVKSLEERSKQVGAKLQAIVKAYYRVLWYEAAPIIARVNRESLWGAMGYASFQDYILGHFGPMDRRTVNYWMQVYDNLTFLNPEQKSHIALRRLIKIAQVVEAKPELVQDRQATPELIGYMRHILTSPCRDYEDVPATMRLYMQNENKASKTLKLHVEITDVVLWHQWRRRVAEHSGKRYLSDSTALRYALASGMQDLEIEDREHYLKLVEWLLTECLPKSAIKPEER